MNYLVPNRIKAQNNLIEQSCSDTVKLIFATVEETQLKIKIQCSNSTVTMVTKEQPYILRNINIKESRSVLLSA